ncbi:hypothetical protein, partial [Campylobacter troglodytis]|uniref:hypothetical protein n=1 Tax=Campylobacter troglodytis TaxID=654363 RepID=UPI0011570AC8
MIRYLPLETKIESLKPYQNEGKTYNLIKTLISAYRGDYELKQIGSTLNFKGKLRISWSFDVKYNKNIDLIFFPQNNPYVNYAFLCIKDFPKQMKDETIEREITSFKVDYNINYDFVKELLSKAEFSESQQQRFFDVRFGSVFVPMELEFEWYLIDSKFSFEEISIVRSDSFLTSPILIG